MEIKKGDRFRCIRGWKDFYKEGNIYQSDVDGRITDEKGNTHHIWADIDDVYFYFLKDASIPMTPPAAKQDSPTSPSHYKSYDVEAIEMMIRIWGKEEAAIFCKLNAFKYRLRMGMKDDIQIELEKESKYLAKWKELRDESNM